MIFIFMEEMSGNQLRLETVRWLDEQFRMIIDLLQSQKDLTDAEKEDLRTTYKELSLRLSRERRELKALGFT